ncbi:MAG: hypothetical protein HY794_00515 [Desulfarculus sp.]|nr:hypothetical protein [Desulfarculus sp.]
MSTHPKKFMGGLVLMIAFIVVFIVIFMPWYGKDSHGKEQNGLNYLDNLYNTISKGSAYYIPKVKKDGEQYLAQQVDLHLAMKDARQAEQAAQLFKASGVEAKAEGANVTAKGSLGKILQNCLADADDMFHNRGEKVAQKYGLPERLVLFTWHKALEAMEKDLNKQKKFPEAKYAATVKTKAVECSYNYYGVAPQNIGDKWGIVVFSLLFYVVYTLWYGFSIMYMFEGAGMQLEH